MNVLSSQFRKQTSWYISWAINPSNKSNKVLKIYSLKSAKAEIGLLQCNLWYKLHIYFLACTWTILQVQSLYSPLYHSRKRKKGETDIFKGERGGEKHILKTVHNKRVCIQQVWGFSPRAAAATQPGGEPRHRTMMTYVPRTCLRHCYPLIREWRSVQVLHLEFARAGSLFSPQPLYCHL